MKFAIALYGSFKDSAGYTWKLPCGYNKKIFETITSNFSQKHEDGRKLKQNELYGGYFIDVHNDRFVAFRFIDGDQDALGRSGVVVTNWAVTQYSKVVGKNIKLLFDRLTMKQMPLGESIDIDFPSDFSFSGSVSASILRSENVISGDKAECVFQIPKCTKNILIQFTMKANQKEAIIKFSPPYSEPPRPIKPTVRLWDNITKLFNFQDIPHIKKFFSGILIVFCCVVAIVLWPKTPQKTKTTDQKTDHKKTLSFPSDIASSNGKTKQDIQPVVKQTNEIIKEKYVIYIPTCVWTHWGISRLNRTVSNKKNKYSWGEIRIDKSEISISFAEHVNLEKKDKEYTILSKKQKLGCIEMQNNTWEILFSEEDTPIVQELSGDYHLFNEKNKEKCGLLLVQEGRIRFELTD